MNIEQQAINQVIANYASENANLRIQAEVLKFQLEDERKKSEETKKE